jgi:ABC-type Fe3+/spermidine/putrescine transport system ATPase subunit
VGTPREIYQRPQTLYAATFFGQANVLHGTAEHLDTDHVRIAWGERTIVCKAPDDRSILARGAPVSMVVRPEGVRLPSDADGENSFEGTLLSREFSGSMETFVIEVDGVQLSVTALSGGFGSEEPAEGERVVVRFDPSAVHLVPSEAGS